MAWFKDGHIYLQSLCFNWLLCTHSLPEFCLSYMLDKSAQMKPLLWERRVIEIWLLTVATSVQFYIPPHRYNFNETSIGKGEMNNQQGYRSGSLLCFIGEYFLISVLDAHAYVCIHICIFICASEYVCAGDHVLYIRKSEVNLDYCDFGMTHLIPLFCHGAWKGIWAAGQQAPGNLLPLSLQYLDKKSMSPYLASWVLGNQLNLRPHACITSTLVTKLLL